VPKAITRPAKAAARSTKPTARPAKTTVTRKPSGRVRKPTVVARTGSLTVTEVSQLDDLRRELERTAATSPLRWNADPDDVQRSVAQLVLTLVEFIRKLLERQAIRRMEAGSLTDEQTEDVGLALMKLEETVRDIAAKFGIPPEDLNLDLGPIGKLM
jgi:gas vesicle protein GvpK